MITIEEIRQSETVKTYIRKADASLKAQGFTEHSFAHVGLVADRAAYILTELDYPPRLVELAQIAAYLHDIGNLVNRVEHSQSGAVMAFRILGEMGMNAEETAEIVTAIGNHDEGNGVPVSDLAAALILADKSDVRSNRVRNQRPEDYDIHDRVNSSVSASGLSVAEDKKSVTLSLTIDTRVSAVGDYFEIFMERMNLCKEAARKLQLEFVLLINGQRML